jgi:hypothetical protein
LVEVLIEIDETVVEETVLDGSELIRCEITWISVGAALLNVMNLTA